MKSFDQDGVWSVHGSWWPRCEGCIWKVIGQPAFSVGYMSSWIQEPVGQSACIWLLVLGFFQVGLWTALAIDAKTDDASIDTCKHIACIQAECCQIMHRFSAVAASRTTSVSRTKNFDLGYCTRPIHGPRWWLCVSLRVGWVQFSSSFDCWLQVQVVVLRLRWLSWPTSLRTLEHACMTFSWRVFSNRLRKNCLKMCSCSCPKCFCPVCQFPCVSLCQHAVCSHIFAVMCSWFLSGRILAVGC